MCIDLIIYNLVFKTQRIILIHTKLRAIFSFLLFSSSFKKNPQTDDFKLLDIAQPLWLQW